MAWHGRMGAMATGQLPGVFGTLAPVLDQYGYLAVNRRPQ